MEKAMQRRLVTPERLPEYGFKLGNSKYRKKLEDEGKFPRRVYYTQRKHAYDEDELLAHGGALVAARDQEAV